MSRGADHAKDQTYFLFGLKQEQLARTDFPLGGYTKPQVRELARELGLPVAAKPDSQEICFVPNGDYAAFIDAYFRERGIAPEKTQGEIRDTEGQVLGEHAGVHHFTVGQRRGLRVAAGEPLYVIATEPASQRVIVGRNEDLLRATLTAKDMNWISIAPICGPIRAQVKIRNKHAAADATISPVGSDTPSGNDARESKSASTSRSAPSLPARPRCFTTAISFWAAGGSNSVRSSSCGRWPTRRSGLARFYAALLDLAIPRLRRTAMRNLELAYPEKSPAERRAIADEVFRSIARLIWVFARFPKSIARTFPSGSVTKDLNIISRRKRPAAASCSPPRISAIGNSAPSPTR